ncbi:MAG TPA: serine/threonine-protein kinase, partial [Polyangiaceae bacterium]|nr:serine/threonine-protein kinase [Polyangiaceae bacterium]
MSTPPVNLPDNRVFGGRYRLVRPLSEGGMGSVWEAEHLALKSTVVVKLIAGQVITAEARQRFLQEARTAAALASPHIVQIFDYGVQDGTPYIAMELLNGESLAQRLSRQGALSPLETEGLVRQVCRAAARAHEANVVHRDLKPGNIFLVASEDELLVKLLDFGIAKATNGAGALQHTLPGAFLGTPTYASPEQAIGEKSLDHRSDLWSIGVIAFECLLGRPPFVGDSAASVVLSVCAGPLPVPSECGPVPSGFDAWFRQACARAPEQRFQNARAMAEALRTVLNPAASAATTAFSSMPATAEPAARVGATDAVPVEGTSAPADAPATRTLATARGKSRVPGWMALAAWVLVV